MKAQIFIVSCAKHFDWLEYALRSVARFATGFNGCTVLVPRSDLDIAIKRWFGDSWGTRTPFHWPTTQGDEWPEKGFLWHMAQIMQADKWCPDADFIVHIDSDCMFTEPVTPHDYFLNEKPILYHERFESIGKQHPDVLRWQEVTQDCVTFPVLQETMRRHPAVHYRKLYAAAREEIDCRTHKNWDEYIRDRNNGFPQTFCEFNTLGNVAMHYFADDYALLDMEKNPWPPQKLVQFWSHSPPHIPQRPVYKGQPFECTPDYFLK